MFGLSPAEMLIVGIVAVVLFGNRLPSVARSMGKSLTEFKKGMRDIQSNMNEAIYSESTPQQVEYDERASAPGPKFEPPADPPTRSVES